MGDGGRVVSTEERIQAKCKELADFLCEKNRSYGDSALKPLGLFGPGDPLAAIGARIDDKLSRIRHRPGAFGEDSVRDLLGYLIMWQLAQEDARRGKTPDGGPWDGGGD